MFQRLRKKSEVSFSHDKLNSYHLIVMYADGDWQVVEWVLRKDMATVSEYLQTWKLELSTTKTVSAIFHLNREANCELKDNFNNETLPFCSEPHLGVTFNRTLTHRRHLESRRKNLTNS